MISKLYIENFRSIRKAEMPLGKITVLTGANNSGKSSLLYGFLVLRDFVMNPNRSLEQLFALPFINLGGFQEVTFNRNLEPIGIGIETFNSVAHSHTSYQLNLSVPASDLHTSSVDFFQFEASMQIGLPYSTNMVRRFSAKQSLDDKTFFFNWNGLLCELDSTPLSTDKFLFETLANEPVSKLIESDFVPIDRGFSKPLYVPISINGNIQSEDEVATWIYNNRFGKALGDLRDHLEEIAGRVIHIHLKEGSPFFQIVTQDAQTHQVTNIVNEGTGTNQLVTILAKVCQPNKKFICIDEPEIHLHPSMVRKLATSFCNIAEKEGKQFLISTHSEHFVQALMNQVAEGKMSPDDVKVYYLERQGVETTIEAQPINEKGQIAGGLSHFYESELADLQSFFKLVD